MAHLLHVDAGLGAGLQELDPVVDGELRGHMTKSQTVDRTGRRVRK